MLRTQEEFLAEVRSRVEQGAVSTSHAATSAYLDASSILVWDDVLPNYPAYVKAARQRTYETIAIGPIVFSGISVCLDSLVPDLIQQRYPTLAPTISLFRRSPLGQPEPSYIHTDRDMGEWTAILYLTEDPPEGDGTVFWRNRETGHTASVARDPQEFYAEWAMWQDRDRWEPWHLVQAHPNRVVVFQGPLFHARAIEANYGEGLQARLIQTVFGTGDWPCVSP